MALRNRGQKTIPSTSTPFIGRENILDDFAREWSKSIDENPRFIVNLYGLGGIGKSQLLKQFLLRHAQDEMACRLNANFDDLTDPIAVLKAILRKTRKGVDSIAFEGTQELMSRFEKLINEAAKASGELPSAITQMLIKGVQITGELFGGTETGKVVREVSESAAQLVEVGVERMASIWRAAKDEKDAKLIEAPVRELTAKLIEELNESCKRGVKFVLSIDTYEKVTSNIDLWLLSDLLGEPVTQIDFDLRLMIAGREPLTEVNRHWHDEWGGELLPFKVEPFTRDETTAFLLQRRGIISSQNIDTIHNTTRGFPFWLDLWARSGIAPEHFFSSGHLQKIEDRLFEMFPNPKHQYWLRQAAVFHRFNQELLALLIKDEVDVAFDWLVHQSSLVEGSERYWKVHDLARKVILTNLRNRSVTLLAEPAEKILQFFKSKLSLPWEKWRDLRFRLMLTERDLTVLSEISYYQALVNAEINDDELDMLIRVADSSLTASSNLLSFACQSLSDVDAKVPERIVFVQSLFEALTGDLKEEELGEKKSKFQQHPFSRYQSIILLNRFAKAFGNKLRLVEQARSCFDDILSLEPEYENAALGKAKLLLDVDARIAIGTLNVVLANNPQHEDAMLQMGRSLTEIRRFDEAIEQFKNAIQIDSKSVSTYNSWGTSLFYLERFEDAIRIYEKALELDSRYAAAYSNIALCLGKLNRYEEAIGQCQRIFDFDTKNTIAYNRWSWCLGQLDRQEEAIEKCKSVIEIDPRNVEALNRWAWCLGKLERHEEAIEKCKNVIEIDPENVEALNRWGWNLGELDRYVETIEQCGRVVEIDKRNIQALNRWAWCLGRLDRYEEAIVKCQNVIEIDAKNIEALNRWAWCLGRLDRYEEAIVKCQNVIEVDAKNVEALNRWGWNLGELNRHVEAIGLCKRAVEVDEKNIQALNRWAWCLGKLDRHEEAITKCQNVIEIDAENIEALNRWAWCLGRLDRHEDAIEQCKSVTEIETKNIEALNRWGWCLAKLDRHEEAIEKCISVTEIDTKNIEALNRWGWCLAELDRHENAIKLYMQALEINPQHAKTHLDLADSLRVLGFYEKAIEQYEIALEHNYEAGAIYNNRGLIHSYLGKSDLAIADYSRALEIDPNELSTNYNMAVMKRKLNDSDASYYIDKVRSICANLPEDDGRVLYALSGLLALENNDDLALEYLDLAAKKKFRSIKEWAQSDIAFEHLKSTQAFQEIFLIPKSSSD